MAEPVRLSDHVTVSEQHISAKSCDKQIKLLTIERNSNDPPRTPAIENLGEERVCAINCTNSIAPPLHAPPDPSEQVRSYIEAGISAATRRAYRADLAHFLRWGGTLPSNEAEIAAYLAAQAGTLKNATLTRRLAALAVAHQQHGSINPCAAPLVRATLRGIRRQHASAQRQAKPLLRDDLFAVLESMGDRLKDQRDRALLLLGFAGGFRRSELVGITLADIERVKAGLIITLRRSKTDQQGLGRKIAIPYGRTRWCPITALDRWLATAAITSGPLFRRLDRHGRLLPSALSSEAVCLIVKARAQAAGFDPALYSGHSLRSGLVTSAVQAGVSLLKIRAQTGHSSDTMMARYIRDAELFTGNAAAAVL